MTININPFTTRSSFPTIDSTTDVVYRAATDAEMAVTVQKFLTRDRRSNTHGTI